MAGNAEKKMSNHNYIYCLRCCKPQDDIYVHLAYKCMKNYTRQEIDVEVQQAKASTKQWLRDGRCWDYLDLVENIPHGPCRIRLVKKLIERGFFILNKPHESDMVLEPADAASTSTATDAPGTSNSAGGWCCPPTLCKKERRSSDSDSDNDTSDPSWKKDPSITSTSVKIEKKEPFSETAVLLVDFKNYLCDTLGVPNWQREVDNVLRFLRYLQPTGNEPTLEFLIKILETRDSISSLRRTDRSASTILHDLENEITFVNYLDTRRDLTTTQFMTTQDELQQYKEFLRKIIELLTGPEQRERMTGGTERVRVYHGLSRVENLHIANVKLNAFLRVFPVTKDGQPPCKRARLQAGFSGGKKHYDKWRALQFAKRQNHLQSHFVLKKPTKRQAERVLKKEGWTMNCPKAMDIVKNWKPSPRLMLETDPRISTHVTHQDWRGLVIKKFLGGTRLGVATKEHFYKGDIVCDYHGKLITAEEGETMMKEQNIHPGLLFFFKVGGKHLCIDAHASPCECHPEMETFGRQINHSRKQPNLKAKQRTVIVDGRKQHTVLFKAVKDIGVGEEILFDYSGGNLLQGEGRDMEY
ncbi:uncharacterized protein ACBT44_000259 isoform 2-T2 [Syngnathus typhle]